MKSRAEKLDDILWECVSAFRNHDKQVEKSKEKIIALFKECVPKEDLDDDYELGDYYPSGWNDCRTETLKNIEEIGK